MYPLPGRTEACRPLIQSWILADLSSPNRERFAQNTICKLPSFLDDVRHEVKIVREELVRQSLIEEYNPLGTQDESADELLERLSIPRSETLWNFRLTDRGRSALAEVLSRRADVARMRVACRDAIICWLYTTAHMTGGRIDKFVSFRQFYTTIFNRYEGYSFDVEMTEDSLRLLAEKELIETFGDDIWLRSREVRLTPAGVSCVEDWGGSVSDFIKGFSDPKQHIGQQFNFRHFQGNFSTGPESQLTYHEAVAASDILKFARAVAQARSALELPQKQVEIIDAAIQDIEVEASSERPSIRRLKALGGNLREVLVGASGSVLAEALLGIWGG